MNRASANVHRNGKTESTLRRSLPTPHLVLARAIHETPTTLREPLALLSYLCVRYS